MQSQTLKSESQNRLKTITLIVLFAHLFIFLCICYFQNAQPIPLKPKNKLVVKTIELTPPSQTSTEPAKKEKTSKISVPQHIAESIEEPVEEKVSPKEDQKAEKKIELKQEPPVVIRDKPTKRGKPKPAKKSIPPKKSVAAKQTKKQVVSTKPKQPAKVVETLSKDAKAAKLRKQELLSQAKKSIEKIDQSHAKVTSVSTNAHPKLITTMQSDSIKDVLADSWSPQEHNYYDELASRIKIALRLPEYGEVKLKLTLENSGRFVGMTILTSKSSKNKSYVTKSLPTLSYPSFGEQFGNKGQYTFTISLNNDL